MRKTRIVTLASAIMFVFVFINASQVHAYSYQYMNPYGYTIIRGGPYPPVGALSNIKYKDSQTFDVARQWWVYGVDTRTEIEFRYKAYVSGHTIWDEFKVEYALEIHLYSSNKIYVWNYDTNQWDCKKSGFFGYGSFWVDTDKYLYTTDDLWFYCKLKVYSYDEYRRTHDTVFSIDQLVPRLLLDYP